MPVYRLSRCSCAFPDPEEADPDGLLAVGGDLSVERLLAAYSLGIYPWYGPGLPILWWSPDPRCVLEIGRFHLPRRLRRIMKTNPFQVTLDTAFSRVVAGCARATRPQGAGTWIVPEMAEAYAELHRAGYAHSVEVWRQGAGGRELAGGIYGVCLGGVFFGESMFHALPNASKVGLATLASFLESRGVTLLDCQQTTAHMLRFGAHEIPREEFNRRLFRAMGREMPPGPWSLG